MTLPAPHPDLPAPGLLDLRPGMHQAYRALESVVVRWADGRTSAEDRLVYRVFGRWDEPAGMAL